MTHRPGGSIPWLGGRVPYRARVEVTLSQPASVYQASPVYIVWPSTAAAFSSLPLFFAANGAFSVFIHCS